MAIGDPLMILGGMPDAVVGVPYRVAPNVSGGYPPYRFMLDGPMPVGFSHCAYTGEVIALPLPGTFAITNLNQTVLDTRGQTASRPIVIPVDMRQGNATGFTFVTLNDPFGGQGLTIYTTSGAVPPQLALVNDRIVAGSVAPTAGQSYSITIVASNGGATVAQTMMFTAIVVAGSVILSGYDGQPILGFDRQMLTGVSP